MSNRILRTVYQGIFKECKHRGLQSDIMSTIGELHQTQGELQFEWRIENAPSLFVNENFEHYSVPFYFADATWKIKMHWSTEGDKVSFELKRMSFGLPITLEYSAGIKNSNGLRCYYFDYNCSLKENSSHTWQIFTRGDLMNKKPYYFPSDALTMMYMLKSTGKYDITNSRFNNLLDLADSFKQLYADERGADLNLNVKGEKFPVHKMMLEARSTISDRNSSEKKKEEMNIGDIDPSSIRVVLDYMYTGDTNKLTTENVLFAYAAANKYGMGQLKNICTAYIKPNLTVEWICQVMRFAVDQSAEDIDLYATRYFIENAAKIIETEHWKTFFKEYHDKAVELLLAKVKKTGI